jgi:hypothetical protein
MFIRTSASAQILRQHDINLCDPIVEPRLSVPTHHSPFFCCSLRLAARNLKAWMITSTRYMITTVPNQSDIPVCMIV